jgi:hypothetical protein
MIFLKHLKINKLNSYKQSGDYFWGGKNCFKMLSGREDSKIPAAKINIVGPRHTAPAIVNESS